MNQKTQDIMIGECLKDNSTPAGGHGVAEVAVSRQQRAVEAAAVRLELRAQRQVAPQRIRQQLVNDEVALPWRHLPHHRLRDAAVL